MIQDRLVDASTGFYDVERIEVLKGPQGTLYGRNATAGTINVITKKPTDEFAASTQVDIGNYDTINATGMINAPISETLSSRFALQTVNHKGYFSDGFNDADEVSARAHLLFKPSSAVSILFTADYSHQGGKGPEDVPLPIGKNPWSSDWYGTPILASAAGFDSDELHFWIASAVGQAAGPARRRPPALAARRPRRRGCESSASPMAPNRVRRRAHQPHFGVMVVTCARGEMRASADGLFIYDPNGKREVALPPRPSMPGRSEVLDDMIAAIRDRRAAAQDGRWAKANVEVTLALLQSARERREDHAETSGRGVTSSASGHTYPFGTVLRAARILYIDHTPDGASHELPALGHDFVVENPEQQTFFVNREVFVSDDVLEREKRRHLRPLLGLCRARLGTEKSRRLQDPRRWPAGRSSSAATAKARSTR